MANPICRCGQETAVLLVGVVDTGEQMAIGADCIPGWLEGMVNAFVADLGISAEIAPESPESAASVAPVPQHSAPAKRRSRKPTGTGNGAGEASGERRSVTLAELEAMTPEQVASLPSDTIISDASEEDFPDPDDSAPAES